MTPLDSSLTNVDATSYTDTTAVLGELYFYAVTAVDTAGNERKTVGSIPSEVEIFDDGCETGDTSGWTMTVQ